MGSGICLVDEGENYVYFGEGKGHKNEEAVLCVKCDTSCPVPRSTKRIGALYRLLGKRRQLRVQRVALRNRGSKLVIEVRV
jgi:hypothetical protein